MSSSGFTISKRLRRALTLAGVVVLGLVAFGVYQVLDAGSSMEQAAYDLKVVSQNLADGRTDEARRSLALAQANSADARDRTDGPIVWVGSNLPVIGDDVAAVRTAARVVDDLAHDTLPDLVEAAQSLAPASLRPRAGRIPVAPIRRAEPAIRTAAAEVDAASAEVAVIDVEHLSGRLQDPLVRLQTELAAAAALSRRGAIAADLLPKMLGESEPRTYALITQNNAEIRATGGIPGAVAVIRAHKGALEIVEQGTEAEFGFRARPVVRLTPDESALYGEVMAMAPQSVNFTPDFPRSAQILRAMWLDRRGMKLDGVLSVDPVAMAHVLEATGPLPFPGGRTMDSTNVVLALENLVYVLVPDYSAQDDYFADVGRILFNAVVAGKGAPEDLLDALTRSTAEGRVMVWSARDDEQRLLSGTAISGDAPKSGTERPQLGVYLNDSLSDKMSYYLRYQVDVSPRSCGSDRSQVLDVTVKLASTAPKDIHAYVRRLVAPDHPAELNGVIRTTVNVYSPFDGRLFDATFDGRDAPLGEFEHLGREVHAITVDLTPQESKVLRFSVRTGAGQPGAVDLRTTPAAQGTGRGEVGPSACTP